MGFASPFPDVDIADVSVFGPALHEDVHPEAACPALIERRGQRLPRRNRQPDPAVASPGVPARSMLAKKVGPAKSFSNKHRRTVLRVRGTLGHSARSAVRPPLGMVAEPDDLRVRQTVCRQASWSSRIGNSGRMAARLNATSCD